MRTQQPIKKENQASEELDRMEQLRNEAELLPGSLRRWQDLIALLIEGKSILRRLRERGASPHDVAYATMHLEAIERRIAIRKDQAQARVNEAGRAVVCPRDGCETPIAILEDEPTLCIVCGTRLPEDPATGHVPTVEARGEQTRLHRDGQMEAARRAGAVTAAAQWLSEIKGVSQITLQHEPEIGFLYRGEVGSCAVLYFGPMESDRIEEFRLEEATSKGTLIKYGDPGFWQDVIERTIADKVRKLGPDRMRNCILLVISESSHQIEDLELAAACRSVAADATGRDDFPFGALVYWWRAGGRGIGCVPVPGANIAEGLQRELLYRCE